MPRVSFFKKFEIDNLLQLIDQEKNEIKALKVEVEKEKAKKEEALKIAKRLKSLDVDIKTIKESTGLDESELEAI